MGNINKTQNPHDLYFKSTFGRKDFAQDFLNNYLPAELLEIIELETLSHEPTQYLSKELKEQFADLVYKTKIQGQEAYISFLFEHKSYRDRMVIFQILKYMISIWEEKIKEDLQQRKNEGQTLAAEDIEIPVIIPIVVYHDKAEWNIKRTLGDMILNFIDLPANIKKYIPNFEYLLTDISHPQKGKKTNLKAEHAIVLETLSKVRYETKEQVTDIFKRALEIYSTTEDKDMTSYFIIEIIVYIISTRNDFDENELKTIAEQISREGGELFMTLAEKLMEKGREEGREEGQAELLIKQLKIKFPQLPGIYEKRLLNAKAETIETIGEGIFTIDSIEDLEKYL